MMDPGIVDRMGKVPSPVLAIIQQAWEFAERVIGQAKDIVTEIGISIGNIVG